jgi:SAM-dependent methyltransferase
MYACGILVALTGTAAASTDLASGEARLALLVTTLVVWFWVCGSLVASWVVYDRSRLVTGDWIHDALPLTPRAWMTIHAGFDDLTPALRTQLPGTHPRVLDMHDRVEMTEASIGRARQAARVMAEPVDFRRLPAGPGTVDAVVLPLSAHELRTAAARHSLLGEIRRILAPGGRVVVVEHLRDLANVAAYGPGALHFHSRRTWTRCFAGAAFEVCREFSITPFVRVFVLRSLA